MSVTKLRTTTVGIAVTPTVISTLFSHYLNRGPLKERPTAHLSYDEGLHLVRSFLEFASHHTVDELQAFTAQWVPHPQWVKVKDVTIEPEYLAQAATHLHEQLGPDGIRLVGGPKWWQWRNPDTAFEAEWIEMRAHANERKRTGEPLKRVMLYVHGGAYFFGSVDEHRYQMQRHARKLQARVFAPKYRLAPQFPFPCGLQDCVAAYLYLLSIQDASEIILAGDSAGGGMVMSMLCILRDQGVPLPAGAVLISPWVDLTHSFPSVGDPAPMDYIPQHGFHHKPSRAWPPPNEDDLIMLREEAEKKKQGAKASKTSKLEEKQQNPVAQTKDSTETDQVKTGGLVTDTKQFLSLTIDGELVRVKDQIQMYTTNELLAHPLVSPIMQPTLGGLPPLLIMVGGGEILRDEQIYLAHKCANPEKYAPAPEKLDQKGRDLLAKYSPTDVQLQLWEDLCHVAPTLSFTRPAKYMYRSVAQFGAWALARAQHRGIEIMDDSNISIISSSESQSNQSRDDEEAAAKSPGDGPGTVGKAGDSLPPFKDHMIRQRVTRHGVTHPLAPESELAGCTIKPELVGIIKEGQVKKWLATKRQWDSRYATTKAKVHKKIIQDMVGGYQNFTPGENPPPSALVGRIRANYKAKQTKKAKSIGLALWSVWGSKHDQVVVGREHQAEMAELKPQSVDEQPHVHPAPSAPSIQNRSADAPSDVETHDPLPSPISPLGDGLSRSPSRRRVVVDEHQTGPELSADKTLVSELIEKRQDNVYTGDHLGVPGTGAAGKRPHLDGIAMPFSLGKEADTASMVTLNSAMSPRTSRDGTSTLASAHISKDEPITPEDEPSRPGLETFVTAEEIMTKPSHQNGEARVPTISS